MTPEPLRPRPEFGGVNAIGFAHRALSVCPDQSPAHASSELAFIQYANLRKNLIQDLSAVHEELTGLEWKGATVLAGSLCEALLLWNLQQQPPADVSNAIATVVPGILAKKPAIAATSCCGRWATSCRSSSRPWGRICARQWGQWSRTCVLSALIS
jgi:hypothetical protein